jgi:uncharacterized protein YbjT (DUF2867 family)
MSTVVVFGGSGFLGRRLAQCLIFQRSTVRIAVRHPGQALHVIRQDQIKVLHANVCNEASVTAALAGSGAMVNALC